MAAKVKNISSFEFLDRPPSDAIKAAVNELKLLGVASQTDANEYELTELGKKVSPVQVKIMKSSPFY